MQELGTIESMSWIVAPRLLRSMRAKSDGDDDMKDDTKVLGDIDPEPKRESGVGRGANPDSEPEHGIGGGSQHDRTEHAGSRDVTEGTTGGTGAEVGGSRNQRTGSGSTGADIGNRPE
jgi:hypothetical protein